MLTGIKDVNTSVSSISSTESTGNPGFETSKTSARKRKYFTLPRNKAYNKKRGQNKISKNDFYSKTIEFRLWLAEEKKIDFDTVTEKKLREYFKKFVKKWNNKKLAMKYYVGVDPLWAVSSPGAYSRTYTRTPEYTQNTPERCDTDSLYDTSSMFGTFGKDTGRKISEMIGANPARNNSNTEDFTGIRTRSATRLDTSTPRHLRELFDPPEPQRAISSVLSPKKRHASMEELSSPCKIKDNDIGVGSLKRTRSRSALCGRHDATATPVAAQSVHNLTNWRNSYAEPDQDEPIATILRRPRSRASITNRSSARQASSTYAPWRNSYAEAMNNSINTRNSVAEVEMELQMDGVFKVPGCRMSVTSKSHAGPVPPPRVPAKSMENLSAWRNNQQAEPTETPTLRRSGSRSSVSSKKTPPDLPERRSSRLSNTSIASSQSMVVVDSQTEEARPKENLPQPLDIRSESTKKPTAPVAPQPQQGTLHQSFNPTKICKPPMSVQKRIPPPTPVRLTQPVPGSMTKPIAPVAPQISETSRETEIETARFTRRASNSSINSRISVASVESSSSSGSGGSSSTFTGSRSSSSSSSFQDAIAVMANKMRNRYRGSDSSDSSSRSSTSSSSTITSDDSIDLKKMTKKRPIPPPPKFKPTLPQTPVVTKAAIDTKKSGKKGMSSKAPAPPPPPPPPPIPTYRGNNSKITKSNADMSVQSGYKKQRNNPPLKDNSNLHTISLKKQQDILLHHQQPRATTKSLGKKRQSEEDLNDLATAAKKLYTGTPITGVSPRHSPRFNKKPAVVESPKAVYV